MVRTRTRYLEIIMKAIMFFPITQLIEEFIPLLNKALFFIVLFMMIIQMFKEGIKKKTFLLYVCTIGEMILVIFVGGATRYNFNEYFYFPFIIIYFEWVVDYKEEIVQWFYDNIYFVRGVTRFYLFLVLFALVLPGAFPYGNLYFKPFGLNGFRSGPTAVFIFVLCIILMNILDKQYLFYSIVPFMMLVMGSSRTYMAVGFLLFMLAWFIFCREKNLRFILIGIFLVAGALILYGMSPSAEKNTELINNANTGYWGYWGTITSGRSVFWAIDMEAFWNSTPFYKIFGHGLNFIYDLNDANRIGAIWAHNDFIQLLVDFGFLGFFLYLAAFYKVFRKAGFRKNPLIAKAIIVIIWIFNAFFNMFFTYFCSMLCYPLLVIMYSVKEEQIE